MRSSFTALTVLAAFTVSVVALPTNSRHVLHEKRSGSSSWSENPDVNVDGNMKLPVRIGLTQNNLHLGDEILMQIASPTSESYGKHWTTQQVRIHSTSN